MCTPLQVLKYNLYRQPTRSVIYAVTKSWCANIITLLTWLTHKVRSYSLQSIRIKTTWVKLLRIFKVLWQTAGCIGISLKEKSWAPWRGKGNQGKLHDKSHMHWRLHRYTFTVHACWWFDMLICIISMWGHVPMNMICEISPSVTSLK